MRSISLNNFSCCAGVWGPLLACSQACSLTAGCPPRCARSCARTTLELSLVLFFISFHSPFLLQTFPFPVVPLGHPSSSPRPSNRGASHLFVPSAQCKGGSQFAHAAWGQSTTGPNSAHSQHVQPTTGSQHGPKARTQWYQVNKMSLNQVPARSQRSSTRAERFLEHLSLTSLPPCPPLHPPC